MIPSNKVYLPPREQYEAYLDQIWDSGWVTNNGELLQALEARLEDRFGVEHVRVVSSGTFALQIAIRALDVSGEVITTPFSYVATTGALLWEQCSPKFVDIDPATFNIDVGLIEDAITESTTAILPTHVFGVACDVDAIAEIARRYDLKVIYDGAHAFGTTYNGRSLLRYGDMTAMSFHATKPFHMVEGGAVVTESDHLAAQVDLLRAFGHEGADHQRNGINAKNSEFHAAMGLCMLPRMDGFLERRREMCTLYRSHLEADGLSFQQVPDACQWNCAYAPVLFPSYDAMMHVKASLEEQDIYPRRYFSPSLNNLPYVEVGECPVAETVARRILCLPFFQEMEDAEIERVAGAVNGAMSAF